jgi:Family of unknown function (DUF6488)
MKKFMSIVTLIATLAVAPTAFADAGGGCHFHGNAPVKEAVLVGCASEYKDGLVSKGKIDSSWKGVKLDKAETVEGKKMKEWKLTFKNPAEKDTTKQTLYMFYTLTGNFIAANFTGK